MCRPFLGAARSTTKRPEFRVSIFNGLLSSRARSKEYLEYFIQKRITSSEKGFYKPIKGGDIEIPFWKRKETKKDWQSFGLVVARYLVKREAFIYPLTTYQLALSKA